MAATIAVLTLLDKKLGLGYRGNMAVPAIPKVVAGAGLEANRKELNHA